MKSKCLLCQKDDVELRISHFIPKFCYRNINKSLNGQQAIHNVKNRKNLGYGDTQITKHLLCEECEDRFNRYGEKIVGEESFKKDSFKLLSKCKDNITTPETDTNQEIFWDHYFYFTISILWRSFATDWNIKNGIKINHYIANLFRNYLLTPEKEHTKYDWFIQIYVDTSNNPELSTICFPKVELIDNKNALCFIIPGLIFVIYLQQDSSNIMMIKDDFSINPLFYKLTKYALDMKAVGNYAKDLQSSKFDIQT